MTEPFKLSEEEVRQLTYLIPRAADAPAIRQFIDHCEALLAQLAQQHAEGMFAPRDEVKDDVARIRKEARRLRAALQRASKAARVELENTMWAHLVGEDGAQAKHGVERLRRLTEAVIEAPLVSLQSQPEMDRLPITSFARAYGRAFNLRPTASVDGPFICLLDYLAGISKQRLGFEFPVSNTAVKAALREFGRPELPSAPAGRPRGKKVS